MNAILKVVEEPYVGESCAFSPENCILVINILCLLMPKSSDLLREFSIMDKIMARLAVDLEVAINGKALYAFRP